MRVPSGANRNGPLLSIAWALITIWKRYVVLWGWTPLFDRSRSPARHRRTVIDLCWSGMLLVSVMSFCFFAHEQASEAYRSAPKVLCALTALAAFRAFDLLVNAAAYAPFGPTTWGGRYRNRDEHCRVLLLTMMNFIELIFWYSVLFTYLAWFQEANFLYPGRDTTPVKPFVVQHAFLLAISTITTVGYGTVAPNDMLTTMVAAFEAVSGLLLIAVGIASSVSLAVSSSPPAMPPADEHSALAAESSPLAWTVRFVSPMIGSVAVLSALYWLFRQSTVIK